MFKNKKRTGAVALSLLILHNSTSILLQHRVQSFTEKGYERPDPLATIMFSEAIKLAISTLLVARTNTLTSDPDLPSIKPNSPDSFWTILKTNHLSAAIPAALYTLATYLQSVGALNLDLLPYLMLSQAKVLITPVLGIFLLNQKFTLRHWACFAMISTGVILAQTAPTTAYSASASVATPNSQTQILGITAMLLSGLFVSLASIQIEKMLQTRKAFMARNAQLAAYSLLSATVVYFWHSLRVPAGSMGFLRAYTHFHVWVFIFLQVTGGFLVAWCVALSGTVVKNHAQVVGFLAALTVPMVVQGNVNLQHWCGVILAVGAVLAYARQGPSETP